MAFVFACFHIECQVHFFRQACQCFNLLFQQRRCFCYPSAWGSPSPSRGSCGDRHMSRLLVQISSAIHMRMKEGCQGAGGLAGLDLDLDWACQKMGLKMSFRHLRIRLLRNSRLLDYFFCRLSFRHDWLRLLPLLLGLRLP